MTVKLIIPWQDERRTKGKKKNNVRNEKGDITTKSIY